jgi:hypothetical protein
VLATDEHGRLLFRTGIAGAGTMTSSGRRYDDDAVQRLRLRPAVDERELAEACPHGVLVVRLPRTMDLDLASPWRDVARQVTYAVDGAEADDAVDGGADVRAYPGLGSAAVRGHLRGLRGPGRGPD